ncbi:MAG TPA: DUF819 family protein [Candidatus Krumholzibacteria bacterium]|jgi:uncharacterized membrane protein
MHESANAALITNDAIVLGILAMILGLVFYTSHSDRRVFRGFYKYVPALLLCYFLPSLLNTFHVIDGNASRLYFVCSRYLLPATLVLLTLSIDLPAILRLGPKALTMFFTATFGIIIGGPLAILIVSTFNPDLVGGQGPDAVWRGLTTVAGSWIGGGANQAAMKEVFEVGDDLFSKMVAVDVLIANVWMAVLLYMAGRSESIDRRLGADTSAIDALRMKVEEFHARHARIPNLRDLMIICAVGLGAMGLSHLLADAIAPWISVNAPGLSKYSLTSGFFWLVVIATTIGVGLSFTRARELEGAGASKVGTVFLYFLVASIGMHMDIGAVFDSPGLFLVGGIWMTIHAGLMLFMARMIKAPTFFMAVGSQANVGGAASAPVVASAFHPALAPVGVLLAVLGYALGTYGAWLCGILMRGAAG